MNKVSTNISGVPILLSETDGNPANHIVYVKNPDKNEILRLNSSLIPKKESWKFACDVLKDIFLPHGYPSSVSEDYLSYQIWDTIQACASTISGTLATKAVLQSVGVGNREASAISAAITWILKDGAGMLSRILFAWVVGTGLDADCKKWRLFADIINDVAMCIEVSILPFYPDLSLQILCFSSSLKALVGVAGGATRSAITQHQAISQNMADVSAKDGSQETCVNLITSFVGLGILSYISNGNIQWIIFGLMTVLHLYSNFKAVQCLNFTFFNESRLILAVQQFLRSDEIMTPKDVNYEESKLLFRAKNGLNDYRIVMGKSLEKIFKKSATLPFQFQFLTHLYKGRKYFIIVHQERRTVQVGLVKDHSPTDLIEAYFHAVIHAFGSAVLHSNEPSSFSKSKMNANFSRNCALTKLISILQSKCHGETTPQTDLPLVMTIDQLASKYYSQFLEGAKNQGWNISRSLIPIDKWRIEWEEEENNVDVDSFTLKAK